jgi:hypothetical protein
MRFAWTLPHNEQFIPKPRRRLTPNLLASAGLMMVAGAAVFFNDKTPFPGWLGLIPTVGTLLVMCGGTQAWINRTVLSWKPLVFIGLISYPFYLWHWPLLSFAHILTAGVPSLGWRAAIVTFAFLLAWMTYRFIEMPVRSQPRWTGLALSGGIAVVACLGLAALSHVVHSRSEKHGFEEIAEAAHGNWGYMGLDLKTAQMALDNHFGRGSGSPKVVFVGDSHMEQYYPRIDRLLTEYPESTKGVFFVTQRSCPPIPYIKDATPAQCAPLAERARSTIAEHADVDTVAIAAAWNRYPAFESDQNEALQTLKEMIAEYRQKGLRVYLILPIPRGEPFNPSRLVKRSVQDLGFVVRQYVDRQEVDAAIDPIASRLAGIAKSTGAELINPVDYLCDATKCRTLADDGLPVYIDDSHLRSGYVRAYGSFVDVIVRGKSQQLP